MNEMEKVTNKRLHRGQQAEARRTTPFSYFNKSVRSDKDKEIDINLLRNVYKLLKFTIF